MLDRSNLSPALRAILGFVDKQPRLAIVGLHEMTVDLDNGTKLKGDAIVIHASGTDSIDDIYLADVEGDVWALAGNGRVDVLCRTEAHRDEAVTPFKVRVGPAALALV